MPAPRMTALGTSAAWPIPRPGCRCPQCREAREVPALSRTRSALLVESAGTTVLVDANPDVARQLERRGGEPRVDRVLVTHGHADHLLGLDDLVHVRAPSPEPLRVHVPASHQRRLRDTFPQLVRPGRERIAIEPWEHGTRLEIGDVVLEGFETGHRAEFATVGVLAEAAGRRVAWATDLGAMPEASVARLAGVDLFVGDGTYVGEAGHGHPGTDAVVALARRIGARRTAIAHVGHVGLADADLRARLGAAVRVLRDDDRLDEADG